MNAVASRLCADINYRIADTLGFAIKDIVLAENTHRERIHQRIAVVAFFKDALAADGRNSKTIPVVRNARDDAFEDPPVARDIERSESDRVHHGYGPSAHGENIAQDAAHAGG